MIRNIHWNYQKVMFEWVCLQWRLFSVSSRCVLRIQSRTFPITRQFKWPTQSLVCCERWIVQFRLDEPILNNVSAPSTVSYCAIRSYRVFTPTLLGKGRERERRKRKRIGNEMQCWSRRRRAAIAARMHSQSVHRIAVYCSINMFVCVCVCSANHTFACSGVDTFCRY